MDQAVDLRTTLRYLGMPVGKRYMFGDNQSVITSSTIPWSLHGKRNNALSHHAAHAAIAHKLLKVCCMPSAQNVGHLLIKCLGFKTFWPLVAPLLFWGGDTEAVNACCSVDLVQGE